MSHGAVGVVPPGAKHRNGLMTKTTMRQDSFTRRKFALEIA